MASAGYNKGYNLASGLYGQGRDAATTQYNQALTPFQQLFTQAGQGASAYGDAVGLGGAEGSARATEAFQSTPGFQSGLNMGLDAIDRRAASRGMLGSGNTNLDTVRYATDYGNQKYNQYVQNLNPYLGQQTQAATGMAGVSTGLGNLLNTSFGNQGNLGYQTQVGIGNANAAAELAKDNTGKNILGGIGTLANLGSKAAGMFF